MKKLKLWQIIGTESMGNGGIRWTTNANLQRFEELKTYKLNESE